MQKLVELTSTLALSAYWMFNIYVVFQRLYFSIRSLLNIPIIDFLIRIIDLWNL